MKYLIPLLVSMFLFGCTGARIVKMTESPRGGIAEYKNGQFVHEKSRHIALAQIDTYCYGKYSIVSEEFNPDVISFEVGGNVFTPDKANFMYITFSCAK